MKAERKVELLEAENKRLSEELNKMREVYDESYQVKMHQYSMQEQQILNEMVALKERLYDEILNFTKEKEIYEKKMKKYLNLKKPSKLAIMLKK